MLAERVVTGVIGGALFLGAVWYGGIPFLLVMAVLAVVGFSELVSMRGFHRFSTPAWLGYGSTLLFLLGSKWSGGEQWLPGTESVPTYFLLAVLFLFFTISVVSKNRYTFQDMTYLFAGSLYIGVSFHLGMQLRLEEGLGMAYFLFVMFAMWSTDSFAYFVGRAIGGPKLWPAISPNKTVSGALGGVVGGILVGIAFALSMNQALTGWVITAALLSVVGQLGDFVESGLKRALDVKDSGRILPGHGGVLDRFDSFLFAAPLAYFAITLILLD